MAETASGWVRAHLGTVATILGVGGTVLGAVVSFTLWFATVSGVAGKVASIEPKLETLRKDLDTAENDIKRMQEALISADRRMNDIRAAMDDNRRVVAEIRRLLDATDAELPQVYESAWNVSTGAPLPSFPRLQDGFGFFDAPLIAPLSSGKERAVIDANDSGWIHAYEPSGGEAPGFPKFTGQWPSFSGVVGDPTYSGKDRLAYGTREGSLFVWRVKGSAARNDSWWHYHHDEHNSGLLGG